MKTLISMTDFVLEQYPKFNPFGNDEQCRIFDKVYAYANFLKQPLTLGMFVPCGERYQNVLKEPNRFNFEHDRDYDIYLNTYAEAKEKVLFQHAKYNDIQPSTDWNFYSLKGVKIAEANNLGKYNLVYRLNTIEDLLNRIQDIELTESAIKQIGL